MFYYKPKKSLYNFKERKKDKARFWVQLSIGDKGEKHTVIIEYYALRSPKGDYLGCLEASRDIHDLQNLKGEKRLLD